MYKPKIGDVIKIGNITGIVCLLSPLGDDDEYIIATNDNDGYSFNGSYELAKKFGKKFTYIIQNGRTVTVLTRRNQEIDFYSRYL